MLQEGFITFFEIIKAILMGIVEGITEWLPISSTGHMILVEQVVKFNASEEFMSMFRVVIQLGAILAVVVLFWNKLWPFGLRQGKVISKPSVWNLWFKVVAATLPVLVISPLDDWMEEHFYNYITVAAMLILYGVLFLVVENRRTTPRVTKLEQISYRDALLIGVWQCLAIIPGTSRSGATIVGGLPAPAWQSSPSIWPSRSWRVHPCSRWSSSSSPGYPSPAPRSPCCWWAVLWPLWSALRPSVS